MNAALRQQLRTAQDKHARARIAAQPHIGFPTCKGCGNHIDEHTHSCQTCHERHNRRRKRAEQTS